jgi:hypothetical protein
MYKAAASMTAAFCLIENQYKMFIANTGLMARRFAENSLNQHGTLTSPLRRPPENSILRERAEKSIVKIAKANGIGLGEEIHKILSQSVDELSSYVQAHGEAPNSDVRQLAIQAALIRATEIGTLARALDITDDEALQALEESEQEHQEDNSAETSYIMSPSTAGAVQLLVRRVGTRFKAKGGSGSMADFVVSTKKASNSGNFEDVNLGFVANKFSGARVNNSTGGFIFYDPEQEQEVTGTTTSTEDKSSFWDNLFKGIDNVVDGITKVAGAVNTTVGNVQNTSGGILDQITNIGGTVGAKSIDQYLKENWLKVVGIIMVLIIFTIVIIRAGRK